MTLKRKKQICTLLKGIETGDAAAVTVVNQTRYIQHNPQTHEGGIGLAELFKQLAKSSPRVNIVRIFSDADFVFAHTEYEFSDSNIGFEIFRFEGDQTVEHWDNIQKREGPNPAGHSMVDGPTDVCDLDFTESNKEVVRSFVDNILINAQFDQIELYIDESYIEHNPHLSDGLPALYSALSEHSSNHSLSIRYEKIHRLLADGNFVLSVCEGFLNETHSSFYDLFRVTDGKIVEHWDTTEAIPSRAQWKNNNGKF